MPGGVLRVVGQCSLRSADLRTARGVSRDEEHSGAAGLRSSLRVAPGGSLQRVPSCGRSDLVYLGVIMESVVYSGVFIESVVFCHCF